MNLKDLNKIDLKDLKNIDLVSHFKNSVQGKPDVLINVVLISISVMAVIFVFSSYRNKSVKLKTEIAALTEKFDAVKRKEKIQKEYDIFMEHVPESIPSDQIVDKISQYAYAHNVQIMSSSPAEEKNDKYMKQTSVNINISSHDYSNIILFMKDIEEAPYAIRVNKWVGSMNKVGARTSRYQNMEEQETEEKLITATVEIGSVRLKDD
jgi:Tfp pilus assembly protein PilO